jgi:C_GCAxxG_C_C family probable redox protein
MSSKVDDAVNMFSSGFLCSQSVLSVFCEEHGLDKDLAFRIANGFGGGIARRQSICGAVSGAIMVISLKYGKTKADDTISHEKTYEVINKFCDEFKIRNKSIICKNILGCDLKTAREKGLFATVCTRCIQDAVEIIEKII